MLVKQQLEGPRLRSAAQLFPSVRDAFSRAERRPHGPARSDVPSNQNRCWKCHEGKQNIYRREVVMERGRQRSLAQTANAAVVQSVMIRDQETGQGLLSVQAPAGESRGD